MSSIHPRGPRDPWASDSGESDSFAVAAFFVVIVLFGVVAYALYSKGAWDALNPDHLIWKDATAARLTASLPPNIGEPPVPLRLPPGAVQSTAPQPAPVIQVQPTAGSQPAPQATVFVPPVGAAMGIAGAQVLPTATAAAQPTQTPASAQPTPAAGSLYKIANTNGDGAYIRRTPSLADRIVPWPDNTPMEYLGEQADGDATRWAKMRDPRGNVGWVPTQYLVPR